jgi:hypothetical protein
MAHRFFAAASLVACVCVQAQGNPVARPSRDVLSFGGTWNGSHLEQRSGCRTAQNNGFRGTYSEFRIYVDIVGRTLSIDEGGITGLSCTWSGSYTDNTGGTGWSGNVSCSDGRTGTFRSQSFFSTTTFMALRLAVQLGGSETCTIDALLSGARLPSA